MARAKIRVEHNTPISYVQTAIVEMSVAGGGEVVFGPGIYDWTGASLGIGAISNMYFRGAGMGNTILLGTSVTKNTATAASDLYFEDFTIDANNVCLLYTSPSPRDATLSRMPSSA